MGLQEVLTVTNHHDRPGHARTHAPWRAEHVCLHGECIGDSKTQDLSALSAAKHVLGVSALGLRVYLCGWLWHYWFCLPPPDRQLDTCYSRVKKHEPTRFPLTYTAMHRQIHKGVSNHTHIQSITRVLEVLYSDAAIPGLLLAHISVAPNQTCPCKMELC